MPYAAADTAARWRPSGRSEERHSFAGFSIFTRTTFLAYGIGLLPFFAFNVWFTFIDPVFTWLGLLDAVGNAIMLAMCVLGWRKASASSAIA